MFLIKIFFIFFIFSFVKSNRFYYMNHPSRNQNNFYRYSLIPSNFYVNYQRPKKIVPVKTYMGYDKSKINRNFNIPYVKTTSYRDPYNNHLVFKYPNYSKTTNNFHFIKKTVDVCLKLNEKCYGFSPYNKDKCCKGSFCNISTKGLTGTCKKNEKIQVIRKENNSKKNNHQKIIQRPLTTEELLGGS